MRGTDWDTAMTVVVERSGQVINDHGRLAMAFYTSGQLFAEEYYTLRDRPRRNRHHAS